MTTIVQRNEGPVPPELPRLQPSGRDPGAADEVLPSKSPARTDWIAVATVVLAGIVGALQVGKVPIDMPALRADLGFGLNAAGWTVGIFAVLGAIGGIPAGTAVGRFGDRPVIISGLVALAAGSAAGASAQSVALLLVARTFEGLGYLLIVVAAPTVLDRIATRTDRALVFGVWAAFMPFGIALALLTGPLFGSWRSFWLVNAALAVISALLITLNVRGTSARKQQPLRDIARDARATIAAGGPLVLASAFMFYNIQYFALVSFLPTLLIEHMGVSAAQSGILTAGVVVVNIAGNLSAGVLLRAGRAPWTLLVTAMTVMALTAIGIFLPGASLDVVVLLCVIFSAVAGLLPATVLGEALKLAPAPHLGAMSIGLVVQGNNLGQLLGPVIVGGLVDRYGWPASAAVVVAAALLGVTIVAIRRQALASRSLLPARQ